MSNNFNDDYFGQQQDKSAEQTDTEQTTFYQDYTSQNAYEAPESTETQGANGLQIASLVLGIIGMPLCCCYGIVGLFFGILGLIFAIIGNKKSGSNGIGIAGHSALSTHAKAVSLYAFSQPGIDLFSEKNVFNERRED